MEGLKLDLEQSFETLLASEPSKKTVEENWVDFKTTLVSTSKKHIPQKNINGSDFTFSLSDHSPSLIFVSPFHNLKT